MKKLFLFFMFLFAVSLSYAQDIDQKYVDSRIEKMISIFFDTTNKKFEGFDRHTIDSYWEKTFNDNSDNNYPFMMYYIKDNNVIEINECKLFPPYTRSLAQSKWYGAYLTALENNGFYYTSTFKITESSSFSYLVYTKKIGDKMITVWIAQITNSVKLEMF